MGPCRSLLETGSFRAAADCGCRGQDETDVGGVLGREDQNRPCFPLRLRISSKNNRKLPDLFNQRTSQSKYNNIVHI